MSATRKPQSFLVQLGDLVLIELTNWRWTWRSMIVLGMVTPLGTIFALKLLLVHASPEDFAYTFAGNIVVSLMFETQIRVGTHVVFMRFSGVLDYFSSLPIRKHTLMLAVVLAFLILSLPSVLVTITGGSFLLHIPLAPSPAIILVIPICALSMAGLGALVGVMAQSSAEAESLGLLVALANAGLGAVIFSPRLLPEWLARLGWLSPATYARSAIRQALLGPVTPIIGIDLAVLVCFSAITFWIVGRKIDWRRR